MPRPRHPNTDVLRWMVVRRKTEGPSDCTSETWIFCFLAHRSTELESVLCRIYVEVEE